MRKKEIIIAAVWVMLVGVSFLLDNPVAEAVWLMQYPLLITFFLIFGNAAVMLAALFLVPAFMAGKRRAAALFFSLFFSSLIGFFMKMIIMRPRPVEMLVPIINIVDYSFPSLHAFIAFSLAATASRFLPKYRFVWYSYAVFIGMSRIYLEVHYLSDVVAGAFLGWLVAKMVIEWQSY